MNNGIFVQDSYSKVGLSDVNLPRAMGGTAIPVSMPYHCFGPNWNLNTRNFIFVIDTSLMQLDRISFLLAGAGGLFYADWGDGIIETYPSFNNTTISHTYNAKGIYTIQLTGNIYAPRLASQASLIRILSFGDLSTTTNGTYTQAFRFNTNLIEVPRSIPPNVTNGFTQAFAGCTRLNDPNIAMWNTTNVNAIDNIFDGCSIFDQNLGSWNTANITNMNGAFNGCLAFNNGGSDSINNWNTGNVTSMSSLFGIARSFNQPLNNWNTSKVTTMANMFQQANSFNQPLNNWDVSSVTNFSVMFNGATSFNSNINNWTLSSSLSASINMSSMFQGATSFNQPIGSWNVSRVTSMGAMFRNANAFNQDLGAWNTNNVTSISEMFFQATNFNNGESNTINNWNTSNITNMSSAFNGAPRFNQPLNNWNVRKVTNFANMFDGAIALNSSLSGWALGADTVGTSCAGMFQNARYNQPLSSWDTSKVTNMSNMFAQQMSVNGFNQDIGSWNTSSVTNMSLMFYNNYYFNNGGSNSINNWNTSNVTNMNSMFYQAGVFNQPIGSWNVSKVTNMASMFYRTNLFNQDISGWNLAGLNANTSLDNFMLDKTGVNAISTANYDALLIGWNNNKLVGANGVANWRTDLRPNFGGAKYTAGGAAAAARAALVSYGWTITDGGTA